MIDMEFGSRKKSVLVRQKVCGFEPRGGRRGCVWGSRELGVASRGEVEKHMGGQTE